MLKILKKPRLLGSLLFVTLLLTSCFQSTPEATPEVSLPPKPRYAAEGTLYVIRPFSILTDNGSTGFRIGDEVQIKEKDSKFVTFVAKGLTSKKEILYFTNDLELLEKLPRPKVPPQVSSNKTESKELESPQPPSSNSGKIATNPQVIQSPPTPVTSRAANQNSSFGSSSPGFFTALELAQKQKEDRNGLISQFKGKEIKVSGQIEKATLEKLNGTSIIMPILRLATAQGMPNVIIKLNPKIATSPAALKAYHQLPTWWGGYEYSSKVEFRQSTSDSIQVRSTYKSSTTYSSGSYYGSYKYESKRSSDWVQLFSPGDRVAVEGILKGAGLNIEIEDATLIAPTN